MTITTRRIGLLGMLVALAAFGIEVPAQSVAHPEATFVIRNARLFDGARIVPRADVWIDNGRIRAVGPALDVPAAIRSIDATGQTLVPGLMDAHVHTMGSVEFLASALALGVTTEVDMGAAPEFALKIKREQAAGRLLELADLRSSGTQPTAPDGHGTEYGRPVPTVSSPGEAQSFIDARIAEGFDFIGEIVYDDGSAYGLQIPTLSKESLAAVIDAAHRRGKLALVHIATLQGAKDAIKAGADGLAHVFIDRPPDDEFVTLAVRHHTFVIPTLSVWAAAAGESMGPSLAADPRLRPYLSSDAIADLHQTLPRNAGKIAYSKEAVHRLLAAGVPILAGTDGHNPGTAHGASLLGELDLLVASGLTPAEALASATSVSTAAFGLDDRGRITQGRRADLLLVNGDPTTDISQIRNISAVWKLGVRDDRDAYRNALASARAAEEASRHAAPPAGSESGLISDFENDAPTTVFGTGWAPETGRLMGGRKPSVRLALVDGGAHTSRKALQISGDIDRGVFGWAGAMFWPGAKPMAPANLSGQRAISFWTKGDGGRYQLMLIVKSRGSMPLAKSFTAGPEWTRVTMPLEEFGTDASDLEAVMFAAVASPGSFTFLIDDVRFER
jgi:imidazolonepropionase-like amidohydrolase